MRVKLRQDPLRHDCRGPPHHRAHMHICTNSSLLALGESDCTYKNEIFLSVLSWILCPSLVTRGVKFGHIKVEADLTQVNKYGRYYSRGAAQIYRAPLTEAFAT